MSRDHAVKQAVGAAVRDASGQATVDIDVTCRTAVRPSFRVQQVAGMFDLPAAAQSCRRFRVNLPAAGESSGGDGGWRIGAIVGPSGSGKSTVAAAAYGPGGRVCPGGLVSIRGDWPVEAAILDGFDSSLDGRTITGMLSAVGFSSPPAWLLPYGSLSNGEQFRCDLARALLADRAVVAFDEFASVVDRQVARFGSAAVAQAVRQGRARCRRFVAITCHYDVLEWLQPDWHVDMAVAVDGPADAAWGCLSRPAITIDVCRCPASLWSRFGRHHYLTGSLHHAARAYAAVWNGIAIGFCATLALLGFVGRRIIHRLVVLPDYQGLGVGRRLLDAVAAHEAESHRVSIVTSHPALIHSLGRSREWRCTRVTACGRPHAGLPRRRGRRVGSPGRATCSFSFIAPDQRGDRA